MAAVNLDAQELVGVAYGNGRFVVSGQLGRLFTSTDGLAWQAVSSGTDANLGNAVFGGGASWSSSPTEAKRLPPRTA